MFVRIKERSGRVVEGELFLDEEARYRREWETRKEQGFIGGKYAYRILTIDGVPYTGEDWRQEVETKFTDEFTSIDVVL